jgi:hypothetical protein
MLPFIDVILFFCVGDLGGRGCRYVLLELLELVIVIGKYMSVA